jgi:2'-5' RNA ligase
MSQDHFEKHAYQKGKIDWNFNVTYNDQPAVAAMAEAYKSVIQHPGLYPPIPPQWLHATILRVGTTDEYTEAEMLAVAEKIQEEVTRITFLKFSFDSWWLWDGNVCFHLSPDDEFKKLYDVVISALESVVGPERTTKSPHGTFIAHTSLAYAKTHNREDEIHAQLAASRVEPAQFNVTHIPLIKQWPISGHYEWEVVKDIVID